MAFQLQTWRGALLFVGATCAWQCAPGMGTPSPGSQPPAQHTSARAPSASAVEAATIQVSPSDPGEEPNVVRFLAFGDMTLAHSIGRAITNSGDPGLPFRSLSGLLEEVDFSYANLEAPLRATTPLEGLVQFRFRALNLANNHIMDAGRDRLLLTAARLRAVRIATSGVGRDMVEAWAPGIVEVRGVRIAFVGASYTSKNSSRRVRLPYVARIDQRSELQKAIADARAKADFVVAAMHAGTEYIRFPVSEQIRYAHAAIEHGADLVIGTHPHVVQRVERYRGKFIFYSLGNFVFYQRRPPHVLESAAVRVTLCTADKSLQGLEVVPLSNHDTTTPQVAEPAAAHAILRRMDLQSPSLLLGTSAQPQAAPCQGLPPLPAGPK